MKTPEDITKEQLIRDLTKLRDRIHKLEQLHDDTTKYQEEISRTKAMYEGLFEFSPDAIAVVNHNGAIVRANKQAERLFGYSKDELVDVEIEVLLPDRFRKKHMKHRREYMVEPHIRPMGTGLKLYGRRKDGQEFPVDIALGPLKAEKNMFVIAVIRDVSELKKTEEALRHTLAEMEHQVLARTSELSVYNEELLAEIEERKRAEAELEEYRKRLEEQVGERTAELTIANKELESFSYSVSHDLRAPLRHMSGFVQLLQKRLSDHADKKSRDYMENIAKASKKMEMLIDDLLAFSRIGRIEIKKRKVRLNDLLREVVREIQYETNARNIVWEVDKLPDVYGDQALLKLAIVNLISNAVKYTRTRPRAEIKIGGKEDRDEVVCSISDNGVGFNMQYVDKLFGVFQRLHSQDEFEGTGIGLANVQRIISRHGGRIWAESVVGQGATFYFTLPKAKEI